MSGVAKLYTGGHYDHNSDRRRAFLAPGWWWLLRTPSSGIATDWTALLIALLTPIWGLPLSAPRLPHAMSRPPAADLSHHEG
jgi:hypothetical protein